jgi:hypothetical protein
MLHLVQHDNARLLRVGSISSLSVFSVVKLGLQLRRLAILVYNAPIGMFRTAHTNQELHLA